MAKNFIAGAIKRPGALTKKAKAADMSMLGFAKKATSKGSKASTLTKQQANFYLHTLRPASKKKGK